LLVIPGSDVLNLKCRLSFSSFAAALGTTSMQLRREGWKVNAKRIYRLDAQEQLIVDQAARKITLRQARIQAGRLE
jgi:hypothetical protein